MEGCTMRPFDRLSLALGKFVIVWAGTWFAVKTIQTLNKNITITINVND